MNVLRPLRSSSRAFTRSPWRPFDSMSMPMMPTAVVTPPSVIQLTWSSGTPPERSLEVPAPEEMQVLIDEAGDNGLPGGIDDLRSAQRRGLRGEAFADGEDARARDEDFLRTERFRCEDVATADHREERVVTHRGHVDRRLHVERDAQPRGEGRAIDGSIDRLGGRGKLRVDSADAGQGAGEPRSDLALRAQVGGQAVDGLGRAPTHLADSSERGGIVVGEDDSSPFLGEARRDRGADDAGGARHHRRPVQELGRYSTTGGRDAVAAPAKDRRTMATPLRITMGTMTSSVEMAVRVGSIS